MIRKNYLRIPFFLLIAMMAVLLWRNLEPVQIPDAGLTAFGSEAVQARVLEIVEQGEIDLGGVVQTYQIVRVELLEGEYKGLVMEMDYGKRQLVSSSITLQPDDLIFVTIGSRPDGVLAVYFMDFVRTKYLLWLGLLFVTTVLLISRWKGLRSLLSMAFSLVMIIGYIIPQVLAGGDPLRVSIIGSIILLTVTLYLTYGWNLKTHSSVISMIFVLLITGLLAGAFVNFTRLTGSGDENILFLRQILNTQINLRGLLLGGMIIGALGVLDDLVTTQASAVFELHHANRSLGFQGLFRAAMRIGQDHVAATVNTLVLAYAGAALPMLLLFTLGRGNYGYLVNFEVVAEEIVRTLVGSLGLITAVPLTTVVAIGFASRADSLGKWEQLLGPMGSGESHPHHH